MPTTSNESAHSSNPGQESSALEKGGEIDFQALFEQTGQELAGTKQALGQTQKELHAVKATAAKTGKTIDSLRSALMGEDGSRQPTAEETLAANIAELEAEADQYLQAAIEAEKAGKAIPLTVNNAIRRIQFQIQTLQKSAEQEKTINELKKNVENARNPQATIDEMAYANMDGQIISALETIYGPTEDMNDVKEAQFKAISNLLVKEIGGLKQNQPAIWARIARNRDDQVKMVNHFVKQAIPPRARQIMEEDHIKKTPMTLGELHAAWKEAKELAAQDPKVRKYATELRQELLSSLYQNSSGKGRGAINQLYRNE